MNLNFFNRVAVITGAGNGIGKQYALYLASRGARVVVNDFNLNLKGQVNEDKNNAQIVKKLIQNNGGVAIYNNNSVLEGQKIIQSAIRNFGKIDILINNAGIIRDSSFQKMKDQDWSKIIDTHLNGTYKCCKAAWSYMKTQKYGRIVNITSSNGLYGAFGQVNYSAAKLGIHGITLSLAKQGRKYNINVNTVAPIGASRMLQTILSQQKIINLKAQYVSPFVSYICHQNSKQSGGVYEVGGRYVAKLRWQRSQGYYFNEKMQIQDVAQKIQEIQSFEGKNDYPSGIQDTLKKIL